MDPLKKIMIVTYFGKLPEWMDSYMPPKGYDFMLITDLDDFNRRVEDMFGMPSPIVEGGGKAWDFRPALGLLYADKLEGYDFWGHTDLDCVYGETKKWVNDDMLSRLDIHSNHGSYVCGPWTLYRNIPEVNNLFRACPNWNKYMFDIVEPTGWVEEEFSRILERSGLRYLYTFYQGNPYTEDPKLKYHDGKLYQDGQEIMMFHFRRSKKWPL